MSTRQPFERDKQSKSPDEDINKSFIKKVKSKMSSLITSPLTKWFGSPNSSNANGSASVESSNSSTEDEALEAQLTQTSSDTRFTLTETRSTSTNTESTETFSMVKSTTDRISFRPETNFVSTHLHSPKEEIIPKPNTSEYKLQNSSSIGGNSIIRKRKSLFDLRNEEEIPAKKKPALNSSGTPSEPYFKRTLVGSPFYAGQTRYGGAASPNVPNIKHINTTLVGKSDNNDSINISQTTRRIMELLENYSSPLIEARRISQTRYVRTPNSSVVSPTNSAYKTQELYVPSMAKLLQFKQKSRLMATTSTARQLIASHSSSLDFTSYPAPKTQCSNANEKSENLTTKMKGYLTRSSQNDKKVSKNYDLAPVHLPTAVLQIDENNLPKFTLGTSVKETLSDKINSEDGTTTSTTVNTMSAQKFLERDNDQMENNVEITSESQANVFCFSNPVMINVGTVENCSPLPNYIFGSPERQSMEQSNDKKNYTEAQTQKWKCEDCWVSNESHVDKCVCCGAGKSISKEKHSSACKVASSQECLDKNIDCNNKTDKVDGSVTKPTITSKWKCELCWVKNDEGVDKCVCCGAKRAQEMTPDTNAKSDSITSFWLCHVCLIKNKSSADKCLACSEAKPSTENKTKDHLSQPNIGMQASNNSTFKNMMKSQCDKWECSTCLVYNDRNKSKCACCDAEKPGTKNKSKEESFNFGNIQNTTFKFGIDPKQNIAEKKTKSTSVPPLETPVKHSETNYSIVPKPPTFTFGIPNQNSDKIISDTETIAEETSKQTFIFGESKSVVSSAPAASTLFSCPLDTGSKFPESTLKSSIETDENIPQVPNIEEPYKAELKNYQKPIGLFAVATTTPALITFGKTGEIANTQAAPAIAAGVDARPQSTFRFSGSGKPGLQLFSGVVTTTSTTSVSFPNVQAPSASISFFQKSEPVHTSSMQLFTETGPVKSSLSLLNKNETMKTSTATSSLSSVPVFNFGANTQNTQAEKPKFNFTFGKTSEIPPVFGLPSSNIGNILSGNGSASGNTAPSNTITGGNGLTTGNQATTENSNLTSNTLFSKIENNKLSSTITSGLIGEPAKNNLMWNNEFGTIKMSSDNSLQQGINNLPVMQSGNLFSQQQKKENMWSPNQNSTLSHKLLSGNTVDPANNSVGSAQGTMFGTPDKKENMTWLGNNNSNIFVSNTGTNSLQKPEPFYFGSSMQFDANNVTPVSTFGNPANKPQTQNIFGISSQVNNNQPAMFSSTLQNQTPPNIFGAQTVNNTASTVGMFGTPNAGANHSFATPTPLQTFEVAPLNPVTPTFNFGAQQTTGVFGFGQQQAQGGVYQFGTQAAVPNAQRQFSIGTAGAASNAINRRPMRRAVRRTSPR